MNVFHSTTSPHDLMPRLDDTLRKAVDHFESHDFDAASLAVRDMAEQMKQMMPAAPMGGLIAIARFMVEYAVQEHQDADEDTAPLTGQKLLDALYDGDTYEVDYFPEGRQPVEGRHMTGVELRDLLSRFERGWAVQGFPEHFKATTSGTDGAQVYELRRIQAAERFCHRCDNSPLANLLGHDALGHRTTAALHKKGVTTVEECHAKGWEWILDYTGVGQKGFARINQHLALIPARLRIAFRKPPGGRTYEETDPMVLEPGDLIYHHDARSYEILERAHRIKRSDGTPYIIARAQKVGTKERVWLEWEVERWTNKEVEALHGLISHDAYYRVTKRLGDQPWEKETLRYGSLALDMIKNCQSAGFTFTGTARDLIALPQDEVCGYSRRFQRAEHGTDNETGHDLSNVADAHMAAELLTREQIHDIARGITDEDHYAVYTSMNGRNGWEASTSLVGRLATPFVYMLAEHHTLTGTAETLTAAPDGTGSDLNWYHMVKKED